MSFIYDIRREGKGGGGVTGFGREWFGISGSPHVHEANLFLSMISEDILNFLTFQLLHGFVETW